jgi:3-oxoacyl-[acyl-carrier protein] reductase
MTKTALVTGGARGIGRACALALADSGFDIALVDLLEKEMAATARDIEARGKRTLTFQADVSDFCPRACDRRTDQREMGTSRRAPEQCGRAEPETDPRDQ